MDNSKTYIGTKTVKAWPVTRGQYNEFRGWTPPEGEDQAVPGYIVEYEPDGNPNVPGHDGYVSWSPATVFETSYKPATVFETSYKPANDWYERLLIEHGDLHERLTKLRAFLDSNDYTLLEVPDRDLLQDQYNFMNGYLKILTARSDRRLGETQPDFPADAGATGIEVVTGGPEPDEPPAGEGEGFGGAVDAEAEALALGGDASSGTSAATDTTQS